MTSEDTGEHTPCAAPKTRRGLTPRVTLTATMAVWLAALILLLLHLTGRLPIGTTGTDLWCGWLLALGASSFLTTFLRVTTGLIAEDWQTGLILGTPGQVPISGRAADALASETSGTYLHPALWPVFGSAAAVFWGMAIAYTAINATGHLHPRHSDLLLGLSMFTTPAASFTAAAVTGPALTRQRQVRRAAVLAHGRLRRTNAEADAVRAVNDLLDADPQRAGVLLRNLTEQVCAAGKGRCAKPDLRVVNGSQPAEPRERSGT